MLKLRLRFLLRLCWLCGIWFVPGCGEDLLPEISRNLKGKTTEHADIWYYKHHALVEDLQREYPGIAIHGDHIITHAGERVELISGDSVYLGQLYQQRNSAHAKLIYHAYRNTLAPYFDALYAQESLPPVAHRDSFIDIRLLEISVHKWIFDKSIYLGVSAERMESLFLYDSFLAEVWHADDKFRQIVRCFFDQIVQLSSPMPKTPLEGRKKRLQLVVTSGFGGGHLTAGRAMQSVLSQAGYDVRLEDTLHLGQSQDPLFVFTGGLHEETVYERYVQQQSDMGLALKVWDLFNRLRRFIPSESNALLEQRIREFKPDMILAPIHNRPELYQLAYSLDVPLALVSTDYELQHLLPDVLVNLDPAVARVLTTTKEPEFFVKALGQLEAR
ncbi:MAG: hypothetical protein OXT67_00285, partial [Zetaproteobacteria bacterium]|nr:hypothetical protein [Zetaproteobacteria bacterium]